MIIVAAIISYISLSKHLLYHAVILFASIKSPLSNFILFKFPKQSVTFIFKVNIKHVPNWNTTDIADATYGEPSLTCFLYQCHKLRLYESQQCNTISRYLIGVRTLNKNL